ncbi:MAG: succinate--CoA ligase subunit beta, partial [Dehalococcoidia bacterium]
LAMATMDLIALLGGRAANFLDIGGAADEQRICRAIELLLDDADVKVAWVNIFGGILRCDMVARALLRVVRERHPSIPFVVRLQGTNASEARDLLASGPMTLMLEPDLGRAARLAVAATGATSQKRGGPAS